jgi:hypothetical protein
MTNLTKALYSYKHAHSTKMLDSYEFGKDVLIFDNSGNYKRGSIEPCADDDGFEYPYFSCEFAFEWIKKNDFSKTANNDINTKELFEGERSLHFILEENLDSIALELLNFIQEMLEIWDVY